jgi:prevent-host-death family protein
METVQVRDAKARLSALIEAAESGTPTTITRHGRPAAVIVPVEDALKLYGVKKRSFAELLLAFPGDVEIERLRTPPRDVEL